MWCKAPRDRRPSTSREALVRYSLSNGGLPQDRPPLLIIDHSAIRDSEVHMQSSTILLVQERLDSGASLRTRLEGKGYTVVEAVDATAAVELVHGTHVELVVTELYLPIGKSRCLARVISKSPALRRTKVLAYTTHGKRADRSWARRIGADGYVITRSGEERLLSVVDHLMQMPLAPRRSRGVRRSIQRRADSSGPANKYGLWRARVEELLTARWDRAGLDMREVAATVVGMFDAGAGDEEVAAFLRDREQSGSGAAWLTTEARLELVHELRARESF